MIAEVLDEYSEVVIDITHGFRSIPILATVNLIIQNFSDTSKIKHILFAKEIERPIRGEAKGVYEIIDLKSYLELANIAFVVRNFSSNYTIAQNIKVPGFTGLIGCMHEFAQNILTLNLIDLAKSSSGLLNEIDIAVSDENNTAIKSGLQELRREISGINDMLDMSKNDRYAVFMQLSQKLIEKGYLLNALSLLFESAKEFMLYQIAKDSKLIQTVTGLEGNDRYRLLHKLSSWITDPKMEIKNFKVLQSELEIDLRLENDIREWEKVLLGLVESGKDVLKYVKNTR